MIDIELPRPRELDAAESPRFRDYSRAMTDIFLSGGVLRRAALRDRAWTA